MGTCAVADSPLALGPLELDGRLPGASNATLLAHVQSAGADGPGTPCVYKPRRGERPLWDFPVGSLAAREVATYVISRALGWEIVPETVWRDEGPLGAGMCQEWVEATDDADPVDVVGVDEVPSGWRVVLVGQDGSGSRVAVVHEDTDELRRIAVLDIVVNNADRKGGHVLRDRAGRLRAIDHGLTCHEEPKLRTVLWGWAGEGLSPAEIGALTRLSTWLDSEAGLVLDAWLSVRELRALRDRVDDLLADPVFPEPGEGWPAIPWPVF